MIYFNWLHSLSCLNLDWKNNIHFVPFHNFGVAVGARGSGNSNIENGLLGREQSRTPKLTVPLKYVFSLKKVFEGEQQSPDFKKNKERSDSW